MSEFSHDVQNTPLLNIQDEEISPWVTIQHRSIKAPNGQVEVYHNFKQADYTSLVSLTTDQKLVLVRQYRPAVDSYTIELPGGLAEENENLAVGVARELTEETGYVAPKLPILLSTTRPDNGRLNNWLHGFFVDNVEFDSLIDVEEGIESFVATVDDVCDMINQVHIHSTLHICLILQAAVQGYWPELLEAILDHKLEMKKC
jgi:8-oxo-dGTP pyrophosphatase MutT (NUDIX family)